MLSVYRDHGVVPKASRTDNFNKTPEDVTRYFYVQRGDLVVNKMKAWSGSVGVSDFEGIVSGDYLVCSVSADLRPRYLHYVLRSRRLIAEMRTRSMGIRPNQERLYWDDLADISVQVPARLEQQRIADFLDDRVDLIDRIIAARREQVNRLDEQMNVRMRSAVAGVLDADPGEPSASLPWVSRIARDAQVVKLARVLVLQRGVDLTEDERVPGSARVITTAGVVGTHHQAIEQGPGVVIGRYGSVGSVHWVDGPFWPHNTTLYVKNALGNDLRWIYYLLRSFPFAAMQARAAIPGVNRNDMATENVPWIPVERQETVAAWLDVKVETYREQRIDLTRSIDLLTEYKSSLVAAAVTGEIDVTTAGRRVPG